MALATLGFEVNECENVRSALGSLAEKLPDLILTDIRLPGSPGTQLIEIVSSTFPFVPIIGMSGEHFNGAKAMAAGAAAFVSKPIEVLELRNVINEALCQQ